MTLGGMEGGRRWIWSARGLAFATLVCVVGFEASTSHGQTQVHPAAEAMSRMDDTLTPRFEVATIKPATQDNYKPIGLYVYPGGRVRAGQSTLKMLIGYAFDLKEFEILRGPGWASQDLYEIEAVPPKSSESRQSNPKSINMPPTEEQRKMLQSLLMDRFRLTFHRETRRGKVYVLTEGKTPLKLEEARRKDYFPMLGVGGHGYGSMTGQTVTMPFMAKRLSTYLEQPVLDRTGLSGVYDFKAAAPSVDTPHESNNDFVSGIFESVESIGLKLKQSEAPTEVLIIDSASRPTEN